MMNEKPVPYKGREDHWIGLFENPFNPTTYKGYRGYLRHTSDTWEFARWISLFSHYRDREFHVFYEGKECQPFPAEREYMRDGEIFECLLSCMRFHHIWYDELGFDFTP